MARTLNKSPGRDMSRLRRFAANHLGTIMTDEMNQSRVYRSDNLELLDRYYEGSQYDGLQDWDEAMGNSEYVPIRNRKPRIIYNLPKAMVDRVASKLTGSSTFPQFIIEDDDDDTDFFRTVQKACKFRRALIEPTKALLAAGSVFVRFYLVGGCVKIEYAKSKYCYPTFDATGELETIEIKYVFEDINDKCTNGNPKQKWYRLELSKTADILYDNPEYRPGVRPEFNVVATAQHNLGWVQGEWLTTHEDKFEIDGYSIYGMILDFCDELNYSISQDSQAASYNKEPQLTINGMDEDEFDKLVKSSEKGWHLGKEGEASYLETGLEAVKVSMERDDKNRHKMLEVARVVFHDPEQMKGQAQSGEALKQLFAPLIELVDELRAILEPKLTNLLIKLAMTCLHYNALGQETVIEAPEGYVPSSLDFTVSWPPIFPPTLADIGLAATAAQSLSQGNIISRESLTRWIGQMIPSVDNIEEELKKIDTQEPLPSPFGTFGDNGGQ